MGMKEVEPHLENVHQNDLVRVCQVNLVLRINQICNFLDDIIRLEDIVVANAVSNGVLGSR